MRIVITKNGNLLIQELEEESPSHLNPILNHFNPHHIQNNQ